MPDVRIHILSTRSLPALLIDEARAYGISIDILAFIETKAVGDEGMVRTIKELAKRPLTVIFTSSNAVEAVGGAMGDGMAGSGDAATGVKWEVFCIGQETRRKAAALLGDARIVGVADSAGELADVIVSRGVRGEMIFFCGDQRREELPRRLKEAGLELEELVVYRTVLTPRKLEREYDAIAFFSPSAVESFFSVNELSAGTVLFAIGKTTGTAIKRYGGDAEDGGQGDSGRGAKAGGGSDAHPLIVSSRPDKELLVKTMIEYFQINK